MRKSELIAGLLVVAGALATATAAMPDPEQATRGVPGQPLIGPAGQLLFTSNRTGVMQIFRVDADGGHETQLTQTASAEFQPVWSTQGRIAFVSYHTGAGDIYTMNVDGGEVRRLTTNPGLDHSPAWSPDGTQIAYVSERDGTSRLWVVQTDGSQERSISGEFVETGTPRWSPDGSKLAFVATIDNKTRIVVADLVNASVAPVTAGNGGEYEPVWSPDGRSIVYVHGGGRTEGVNLRLVRLGKTDTVALTSGGYTHSQPRFSPDGSMILFLSNATSQGAVMNVHTIKADGSGMVNLTRWEHADMSASWSDDGRQVFFMSFRDWPGQIYRINSDGSNVFRVTRSQAQDGYPVTRPLASVKRGVTQLH